MCARIDMELQGQMLENMASCRSLYIRSCTSSQCGVHPVPFLAFTPKTPSLAVPH
jgi:hypothetical protein